MMHSAKLSNIMTKIAQSFRMLSEQDFVCMCVFCCCCSLSITVKETSLRRIVFTAEITVAYFKLNSEKLNVLLIISSIEFVITNARSWKYSECHISIIVIKHTKEKRRRKKVFAENSSYIYIFQFSFCSILIWYTLAP